MKQNEVVPFGYDDQLVRTVLIDNTPWFVAKDVCAALGLSDVNKTVSKLDDDEKLIRKLFVSGQDRHVIIINESGLYTLILRSNKPEARKFRKWVTSEVLPSIRKNGVYDVTGNINDRLERIEKALEGLTEFTSTILKIVYEPKVIEYRTINSQLDEYIYTFYKKHVDDSVPTAIYTKAINVWELFKYDNNAKYSKTEFLERFRAIYPQFAFEKYKNVDVFWGFRLVDTCGVC